jgi:hypothetical protein
MSFKELHMPVAVGHALWFAVAALRRTRGYTDKVGALQEMLK